MREQGITSPASGRHSGQLRASHACAENSVPSFAATRCCAPRIAVRHAGRGNSSNCIIGHRPDASLFTCLVLCAHCHQAEHTRRRARPGKGDVAPERSLSPCSARPAALRLDRCGAILGLSSHGSGQSVHTNLQAPDQQRLPLPEPLPRQSSSSVPQSYVSFVSSRSAPFSNEAADFPIKTLISNRGALRSYLENTLLSLLKA